MGLDVTVIDLREKFSTAGDRSAANGGKWEKNMRALGYRRILK